MPAVTFDQHTLQLDGKRLWIVSGTVAYNGAPSECWRDRLVAAKRLGLNTIVVPAVWAEHELILGKFDFKGDRSIATFLRLAADLGLHVIVRVGPHVDDTMDLGGIPPWLMAQLDPAEPLRSPGPAWMAACAAWLTALAKEIAPLQTTRARGGSPGPIIAVQLEHRWFVGDDERAEQYMGGLARFLRERNIDVPVLNTNNLFATAEGQIECWAGTDDLHAITRQLGSVLDSQPRIAADIGAERIATWGDAESIPSQALAHAVACVLAGGGQFNVAACARGMRFASSAGRTGTSASRFFTPGSAADLIDESGAPTAALAPVRRLCTFASTFARLFGALDPAAEAAVLTPLVPDASNTKPRSAAQTSVIHKPGDQGAVTFVFGRPGDTIAITLPDGAQAPVTLPSTGIAWLLQDAHLFARTTLDLCTLCVFAHRGSTLACFGPAKATGHIAINQAAIEVAVPGGPTPHVETLEGVTIVVCNEEQIDESVLLDDRIVIGARRVDSDGHPVGPRNTACTVVRVDGQVESCKASTQRSLPRAPSIRAIDQAVGTAAYADGTSERFVRIDGPAPLAMLGAPSGYVWLRAEINAKSARKAKIACFDISDRAHLFAQGTAVALLGVAPGATGCTTTLQLRKGKQHIVALVDNLGRSTHEGIARTDKALGHIEEIAPLKAGAAKVETRTPVDLSAMGRPILGLHSGDVTHSRRLGWAFAHRRKSPIVLTIDQPPAIGGVVVNDALVALIEPARPARIRLASDVLKQGNNTIELAFVAPPANIDALLAQARAHAALFEVTANLTETSSWASAAWAPPGPRAWQPLSADKPGVHAAGTPAWWRLTFDPFASEDHALWFEPLGLTKGQLFLNGRNLCRYFVTTADGKPVKGQDRYWLPTPWLNDDEPNELVIFDEHGFSPEKARLQVV